jgi:hypothetical protein
MNEDLAGRIMAHAFHDELEKIAGIPSSIRSSGGGAVGELMRKKQFYGKEGARSVALAKKEGALPKNLSWRSKFKTPEQKTLVESALKDGDRGSQAAKTLRSKIPTMPGQGTPRGHQLRTNPNATLEF